MLRGASKNLVVGMQRLSGTRSDASPRLSMASRRETQRDSERGFKESGRRNTSVVVQWPDASLRSARHWL